MTRVIATISLLLVLLASHAFGQDTTSLRGTVTDLTGAVIPGATVTMTNVANQAVRTTSSGEDGTYTFPQVVPGLYELKAVSAGFNDVVVSDLRLLVNQPATQNVRFERIGSVAETVSVSADAVHLNTTDASLGNAIGTKPIVELPFNARNVVGLLSLQPGVVTLGDIERPVNDSRGGNVNGARNDQSNITLDGVDVNDQMDRGAFKSVLRMTLDSVQEFRTTTLNATADQGRSSGAQVSMVTKSGTNDLHGSAYWFHRNTVTTANEFFNNAVVASPDNPTGGIPRPKLIRNIGGASLGGPVVKNRVFLFGNWEHRRDAREESTNRFVPSALMRQGILQYERPDGSIAQVSPEQLRTLVDPLGIGASAAALQVLQSYPAPNNLDVGDALNQVGFRFNAPIGLRWNTYIARMDFVVDRDARHNAFLRANLQNDHENTLPQFPGMPANSVNLDNSKGLAAGLTSLLGASMVNDFRFGFTRQGMEISGAAKDSYVSFRGLHLPVGTSRTSRALVPTWTLSDAITRISGSHTTKFGFVFRGIRNQRLSDQNSYFAGMTNASWLAGQGNTLDAPFTDMASGSRAPFRDAAMAVMGVVSQVRAQYNYLVEGTALEMGQPVRRSFNANEWELFISDEWRVRPNVTVSAGLRWSLMPPVHEANGQQLSPSVPIGDWLHQRAALAENGISNLEAGRISYFPVGSGGRDLYDFHKKNFAPRLGIAWSPGFESGLGKLLFGGAGRSSVRAGFGMFYDIFGQGIMRRFDSVAYGLSTSLTNPSGEQSLSTAPRYTGLTAIPQSLVMSPPPAQFPSMPGDNFEIINGLDDTIRPPYSFTANFNIGRELDRGWFVQAGYVGRFGRRLLTQEDAAAPTNFRDPISGQTYFDAASTLVKAGRAGIAPEDTPAIPFFENVWANFNDSFWAQNFGDPVNLSVTQNIAILNDFLVGNEDTTALLNWLDSPRGSFGCEATGACSIYGPWLMFHPQYSYLSVWRSIGSSSYNAFQFNLRKTWNSGDIVDFNYTLSKSIDFGSSAERVGDTIGVITNPWFRNQFRAVSDFDTRHLFTASAVYGIPVGRGQRFGTGFNGFLDAVLGGWQVSGIWRQSSGFPVSVGNGNFWPTNWGVGAFATAVADAPVTGSFKNAPAIGGPGGPNIFANPTAAYDAFDFTLPGDSGTRNALRGDGFFQIDANLAKRFTMPWSENHSLQFRAEAFNLTNTVRFDIYAMSLDMGNRATFGKYNSQLGAPRVMQFGLRYDF